VPKCAVGPASVRAARQLDEGSHRNGVHPRVPLLLTLPAGSGRWVVRELRANSGLRRIEVWTSYRMISDR